MTLIEWRAEFETGVADVDYEHQSLIQLINALHASLSAPEPETTVTDFLGELDARISAHFALEEKIMRERGYDQYQQHKEDHERLLEDIRDIMDEYETGAHFDEAKLGERLRHWFTQHFKTHDARFHRHLA
jgi:hemerythrin-like metal-binding protein